MNLHTHDALVGNVGIPFQVKQNGHVVLVVGGVESRNIDERAAETITKVLSIECWLSVIGKGDWFAQSICALYIFGIPSPGAVDERKKGYQEKHPAEPRGSIAGGPYDCHDHDSGIEMRGPRWRAEVFAMSIFPELPQA